MTKDLRTLYDCLVDGVGSEELICSAFAGDRWALAETRDSSGLAMFTPGRSIVPVFPHGLRNQPVKQAAAAVKSWNLEEASAALAAVNAVYNTPARADTLSATSQHYMEGLNLAGKTVGVVGHLRSVERLRDEAKRLYVLERQPQMGDYPDPACDWLLEECDIVLITGSALVNKTLPHLLSLCERAYTVLTGPSVPLCPALLDYGIDRLSGFAVTDREGLRRYVASGEHGSPYRFGRPFVLSK